MGLNYDPAKLTPEQRDKIEQYQMSKKQLQALDDMSTMFAQLFNVLKSTGTNDELKKLGTLLVDTREQLVELNKKESPELDNDPVVKAVDNLGKQLTKAIDKIDVKPTIQSNVAAPNVNVDAPDLSKLEKILSTDVPKAFREAIKAISIPENDDTNTVQLLSDIAEQLSSIDTGVRMKPQAPTTMETLPAINEGGVAQPLHIDQSGALYITGAITAQSSTLADFSVNDIDDSTSTEYYGFTKPDATWLVKGITDTGVSYATVANNGSVADYTTAWTNKATLTYGRFDEVF